MEIIRQGFLSYLNKKVFVIFLIEANNPYLEVYAKKGISPPQERYDLKKAKYCNAKIRTCIESISPFEFVIVLDNDILLFACKRWDLMNDWVNCLKIKLRELKILSPKENFYSRPPAMKLHTRNPRDPLPAINPALLVERIPGLEVQQQSIEIATIEANDDQNTSHSQNNLIVTEESSIVVESLSGIEDDSVTIPVFNFATSNTSSQNLINLLSNPLLRHRQNVDFTTARNDNDDEFLEIEDEDDEGGQEINEISDEIPITSLNIEYIPPPEVAENITIIPVSAESFNEASSKVDNAKATRIKIEVDYTYDYMYKATSSPMPTTVESLPTTSNSEIKKEIKNILPLPPKSTPVHEKRKSLREQQVFQLRHEINNEIRFKLRKKDCIDAMAFVSYQDSLWIAGFKPSPQLYVFHIGDQLLAINNIANIKSNVDAQKYIKMCGGLFVEITIRRLPLAEIFILKRDFENQCLGFIRDGNSLLDIVPNSIASRSGIPARPSTNDDDSIFWIITEINFRPLSIISHKKYDETDLLLNSVGLETSVLLQPSDFIAKIRKDLKAMKNYRDYTLQ